MHATSTTPSASAVIMDPERTSSGDKSLRKRGKRILGAPFNAMGTLLRTRSKEARKPGGVGSSAPAAFLTRLPDPSWIDIEMMGYWLKKCDMEHGENCRKPFGLDPSRLAKAQWLIDVRRKCLTSAKPGHRYACLSYLWSGASTLKTGKDNLKSLLEENSLATHWEEIPKTIRNTVDLVDQLGIPYLWVDCLCIIQDDTDSKHDQIQAMSGIYANAYVTIVAGNGWDANHGLRGIQGVTEPRQLSTFLKSDFRENLQPYSSIWYSRGWTFQEMIFSPRKIMFQYQLAIWECNHDSWHESSLSAIPTALQASYFKPTISPWQSQIKLSAWPDVQQYIYLVHDYAQRKLSYGDDALHAIASLLSVMSTSFIGGFITGLPEIFFDEALLWQSAEPMQRRRSTTRLDIPSWSWVGWEGEIMTVDWKHHFRHLYAKNGEPLGSVQRTGRSELRELSRTAIPVWDESHPVPPVLPVSPKVIWFYGNTLLERFPIKISGHTYIKHLADASLPPPPGWSFSGSGYVLNNQESTTSSFPLPVPSEQVSRTVSARYLFGRTTRAYLKSSKGVLISPSPQRLHQLTTYLQDTNGYRIGELNLNLAQTNYQESSEQTEYELVVISAGEIMANVKVLKNTAYSKSSDMHEIDGYVWNQALKHAAYSTSDLLRIELSDGFGWEPAYFEFPLRSVTSTDFQFKPFLQHRVGLYHVLWIEWEDGIAYRRGLGRVLKEAWDCMATEEIDLVLG